MTPFPPEGVVQGATNTPNPDPNAIPSGNDGSGDLRAEALKLARLLDPAAFNDRAKPENLGQRWDQYTRQQTAMDHATIALIRGYRLVSEDEATVERVARAMWAADLADFSAESGATMRATDENWVLACSTGSYQRAARAAVRALLDGER